MATGTVQTRASQGPCDGEIAQVGPQCDRVLTEGGAGDVMAEEAM